MRVVAGIDVWRDLAGQTHSDLFYADVQLKSGRALPLPVEHEERGIYIVEGSLEIGGQVHGANQLLVFRGGDAITLTAQR